MKFVAMMLLSVGTWAMAPERASAQTVVPCDVLCWARGHDAEGQTLLCERKIGSQKEVDYWKGVTQIGWGALNNGKGTAVISLDEGGNGLSCPKTTEDFQGSSFTYRSVPVIGSVYGAKVCHSNLPGPSNDLKIGSIVEIDLCQAANDGRQTNFFPDPTSK